jgi:hypothetical protein
VLAVEVVSAETLRVSATAESTTLKLRDLLDVSLMVRVSRASFLLRAQRFRRQEVQLRLLKGRRRGRPGRCELTDRGRRGVTKTYEESHDRG